MAYAVYSVTAAAPSLSWGLYKIAHTPTSRLRVGYHVVPRFEGPRYDCRFDSARFDSARLDMAQPALAHLKPRTEVRGLRPLGNALYLDRLIAGGIVADTLPLTNLSDTLPLANLRIQLDRENMLGNGIDVSA
jgi:hypothetical protein